MQPPENDMTEPLYSKRLRAFLRSDEPIPAQGTEELAMILIWLDTADETWRQGANHMPDISQPGYRKDVQSVMTQLRTYLEEFSNHDRLHPSPITPQKDLQRYASKAILQPLPYETFGITKSDSTDGDGPLAPTVEAPALTKEKTTTTNTGISCLPGLGPLYRIQKIDRIGTPELRVSVETCMCASSVFRRRLLTLPDITRYVRIPEGGKRRFGSSCVPCWGFKCGWHHGVLVSTDVQVQNWVSITLLHTAGRLLSFIDPSLGFARFHSLPGDEAKGKTAHFAWGTPKDRRLIVKVEGPCE